MSKYPSERKTMPGQGEGPNRDVQKTDPNKQRQGGAMDTEEGDERKRRPA
jgi:hypothetical protein